MGWRNTEQTWGVVSRCLHWGIGSLLLIQLALGIVADSWPLSPLKLDLFVWHKSLGVLILLLVLLRILWRLANAVPSLPSNMPQWQHRAARASVAILYLCMLGLPLSGWVIQSASNVPFKIFWLFPLPDIVAVSKGVADAFKIVHGGFVALLSATLALHISAAIYHHRIRRDGVLRRMWSGESNIR